jgi:NhaP-type Na+/H+ or K+/H+ antiporter
MLDVLKMIWFLVVILPILIFQEGLAWFKKYLEKNNREWNWIYFVYAILVVLVIILLILLINGYPW